MNRFWLLRLSGLVILVVAIQILETQGRTPLTSPVATTQNVTVQLGADGTATLAATSVNNGSLGSGTLTYTIQKIVYGAVIENQTLTLATPTGVAFTAIRYASFGNPSGNVNTGNYIFGNCTASNSTTVVSSILVGNASGSIVASSTTFGDPCSGVTKFLAVQAAYSNDAANQLYTCADVAGPNYVLLTVTDSNGDTSTATAQVTVLASPTASISSTPSVGTVGTTVTLTGTNLSGATGITVNGTAATITSASATTLLFTVPTGASSGNLLVNLPCSQSLSMAFTVVSPLPVHLVSFTAQAQVSGVALAWRTASELSSARFEIERSLDGLRFASIGSVPAAGTSSTQHAYTYLDVQLPTGATMLYYRLLQVDLDGTVAYSPVQVVALKAGELRVYPNPAGHTATLSGAGAGALVQVYNVVGSLVFKGQADASGTMTLVLPASLPGGLYLVHSGVGLILPLLVQ